MSYNKDNALIKIENNSLKEIGKRNLPQIIDGVKKIGKVVGWGSIFTAEFIGIFVGGLALGNIPIALAGISLSYGSMLRTVFNAQYKTEPSLMFRSRMKNGEREISQDARFSLASKMKGYNEAEKAGMMGLQAMVGLSRWKENLKYTNYEEGKNGEKIYNESISTYTHGINIKTFKMLEDLGYIKIDKINDRIKKDKNGEFQEKRKLLIIEKVFFRNFKDIKKIGIAALKRDKETLESMKKTFQKITFRLTDKEIDFEELYKKSANIGEIKDKKEQTALRRLSIIFNNKQGILVTKNIDIGKDSFGRDIIKYNMKESFGKRIEKNIRAEQNNENLLEHDNSEQDENLKINDKLKINENSKYHNNLNSKSLRFRNNLQENVNSEGLEARAIVALKEKQEQKIEQSQEMEK